MKNPEIRSLFWMIPIYPWQMQGSLKTEAGMSGSERRCDTKRFQSDLVFRRQGKPAASRKAEKRQGVNSLLEPPEGSKPANTVILAQRDPVWTDDL